MGIRGHCSMGHGCIIHIFKIPKILLRAFIRIFSHDDEYLVMFSLIRIFTAGRHGRPPDSGDPQWSAEWSARPGGGDKLQLGGSGDLRLGNDHSQIDRETRSNHSNLTLKTKYYVPN